MWRHLAEVGTEAPLRSIQDQSLLLENKRRYCHVGVLKPGSRVHTLAEPLLHRLDPFLIE